MARAGRPKAELTLSDEERAALEGWVRRRSTPQAWALRCRIVLACAEGASNKDVAARLGSTPHAVDRWRARFVEHSRGPASSPANASVGTAGRSNGRSLGSSATAASPSDANERARTSSPSSAWPPPNGSTNTLIPELRRRAFRYSPCRHPLGRGRPHSRRAGSGDDCAAPWHRGRLPSVPPGTHPRRTGVGAAAVSGPGRCGSRPAALFTEARRRRARSAGPSPCHGGLLLR